MLLEPRSPFETQVSIPTHPSILQTEMLREGTLAAPCHLAQWQSERVLKSVGPDLEPEVREGFSPLPSLVRLSSIPEML